MCYVWRCLMMYAHKYIHIWEDCIAHTRITDQLISTTSNYVVFYNSIESIQIWIMKTIITIFILLWICKNLHVWGRLYSTMSTYEYEYWMYVDNNEETKMKKYTHNSIWIMISLPIRRTRGVYLLHRQPFN